MITQTHNEYNFLQIVEKRLSARQKGMRYKKIVRRKNAERIEFKHKSKVNLWKN